MLNIIVKAEGNPLFCHCNQAVCARLISTAYDLINHRFWSALRQLCGPRLSLINFLAQTISPAFGVWSLVCKAKS